MMDLIELSVVGISFMRIGAAVRLLNALGMLVSQVNVSLVVNALWSA